MGSEEQKVRFHRLHVEEIMEEEKKEFYHYRIVTLFFKRRLS